MFADRNPFLGKLFVDGLSAPDLYHLYTSVKREVEADDFVNS